MPKINKSLLLGYSAQQMFDLIADVERYPEFIPWCSGATLMSKTDRELVAELSLSKGGIKQKFATRNQMDAPRRMSIKLENGPFKYLNGVWRFEPMGDSACQVSLEMDFEIAGRLLSMAFSPVFQQATNMLVDAFEKRAKQVYG